MAKVFKCRDVGVDCDWQARAESEEQIMAQTRQHAKTAHDMEQIPQEMEDKIRAAIKEE
jgi:predicted small metal-binding protein